MIALLRLFGILPYPSRSVLVRVFELRDHHGREINVEARDYSVGVSGVLTFIGTYSDPNELVCVYAGGTWSRLVEVAG